MSLVQHFFKFFYMFKKCIVAVSKKRRAADILYEFTSEKSYSNLKASFTQSHIYPKRPKFC